MVCNLITLNSKRFLILNLAIGQVTALPTLIFLNKGNTVLRVEGAIRLMRVTMTTG